ncbi:hypothetical protein P886_5066 [Alteromonadaceae bacterium 2753L.S.0a.02]|nr:hypothetical protein P886_5066 [Alteromonadaceae bacterium 2753L.S.0a.02]
MIELSFNCAKCFGRLGRQAKIDNNLGYDIVFIPEMAGATIRLNDKILSANRKGIYINKRNLGRFKPFFFGMFTDYTKYEIEGERYSIKVDQLEERRELFFGGDAIAVGEFEPFNSVLLMSFGGVCTYRFEDESFLSAVLVAMVEFYISEWRSLEG